jgi:hypothetical protein
VPEKEKGKASGKEGAPGSDNTFKDGGKRKGRGRGGCRDDL